jgi:hypothetical protein
LIADNDFDGILVTPLGSGSVGVVLNRVASYNNFAGLYVIGSNGTGSLIVTVKRSVLARNVLGVDVYSAPGAAATSLMLVRSVVANNSTGIVALSATVRIGRSTVTGNVIGWDSLGGTLLSYGDNRIDGNGDSPPAPTKIPTK